VPFRNLKGKERVKYLQPEVFSKLKTMGVDYDEQHEQDLLRMQEGN
jgi:hypothetical protein